jgi:hypothetical protein
VSRFLRPSSDATAATRAGRASSMDCLYGGAGVVFAGALAAFAIPRARRPRKQLDVDPAEAVISRCACAGCWGPLVDPRLKASGTHTA